MVSVWSHFEQLPARRQAHSRAVAAQATRAANLLPGRWRGLLTRAGLLHDIGYASPATHLHAVDGALLLADLGEDAAITHIVATHTGAPFEARARGLDPALFDPFRYDGPAPIALMRSIITWADLTTSPTGDLVTVEQRLSEILARYSADDPVHRAVSEAHDWLLLAGSDPTATADDDPLSR